MLNIQKVTEQVLLDETSNLKYINDDSVVVTVYVTVRSAPTLCAS